MTARSCALLGALLALLAAPAAEADVPPGRPHRVATLRLRHATATAQGSTDAERRRVLDAFREQVLRGQGRLDRCMADLPAPGVFEHPSRRILVGQLTVDSTGVPGDPRYTRRDRLSAAATRCVTALLRDLRLPRARTGRTRVRFRFVGAVRPGI